MWAFVALNLYQLTDSKVQLYKNNVNSNKSNNMEQERFYTGKRTSTQSKFCGKHPNEPIFFIGDKNNRS